MTEDHHHAQPIEHSLPSALSPPSRIDAAHPTANQPEVAATQDPTTALDAGTSSLSVNTPAVEQLRNHASQLASHLQGKQRTLDHREAKLNAQLATLDNETRTARMIIRQGEEELAGRLHQLEERESKNKQQLHDLQQVLVRRERELTDPTKPFMKQAAKLERSLRELKVDTKNRNYKPDTKRPELDSDDRSAESQQEATTENPLRTNPQITSATGIEQKKAQLQERAVHLEKRSATLKQLQEDITRLNRETLEMRLVTEELWGKLSQQMTPAALTQSVSELRKKLADHYQMADAKVARQREELEKLRTELSARFQQLNQRRYALQNWLESRHEEIEQQATRLVGREQELNAQKTEFQLQQQKWDQQRQSLQDEIQCLKDQLRKDKNREPLEVIGS